MFETDDVLRLSEFYFCQKDLVLQRLDLNSQKKVICKTRASVDKEE